MTLESLETLNDQQLQSVITRAAELLKHHDKERKEKALADARTILEAAGLSLKRCGLQQPNKIPRRLRRIKASKTGQPKPN